MNKKDFRVVQGGKVKSDSASNPLNSPASLAEVLQISRASAEDVVSDYHTNQYPFQLSLVAQLSTLTDVITSSGLIDLETFMDRCNKKLHDLNEQLSKDHANPDQGSDAVTDMKMSTGDVEVIMDHK